MMSRWAAEYHARFQVAVNYQSIGSGKGIGNLLERNTDFACTDLPLSGDQLRRAKEAGGVVQIPFLLTAVVPVYHLDGLAEPLRFSGPVLADIFLGRIRKWSDPALRVLNPGVDLPDRDIVVLRPADASGNTQLFTSYLSRVSDAWRRKVGSGTEVKWPVGISPRGGAGLLGVLAQTDGSIGFAELTFLLQQNNVQRGLLRNRAGEWVEPTLASVTATAAGARLDTPEAFGATLLDAPGKKAYPVCGAVWLVWYARADEDRRKPLVDFLTWIVHEGQEFMPALGYARIPRELVDQIDATLKSDRAD
jgi:phosphate transport system substrate-binding protein